MLVHHLPPVCTGLLANRQGARIDMLPSRNVHGMGNSFSVESPDYK